MLFGWGEGSFLIKKLINQRNKENFGHTLKPSPLPISCSSSVCHILSMGQWWGDDAAVENEGWSLYMVAGGEWKLDVLWLWSVMVCSVDQE